MTGPTLNYDTARCSGWQEWFDAIPIPACAECLRRTAPGRLDWQAYMSPVEFVKGECPSRIAPG